jgi:hypothetical protein
MNPEAALSMVMSGLEGLRILLARSAAPRGESFDELDSALQIAWISAARFAVEIGGGNSQQG